MNNRHIIIIMGPQGSGKGTQAQRLAENKNFAVITMGHLLRQEAEKKTKLGLQIDALMTAGELIDDDLTFTVLKEGLEDLPLKKNVILDGFPRTVEQANQLDTIIDVFAIIYITLSPEEAIKRIGGRIECANGHTYNIHSAPPKKHGVCDIDSLPLQKRDDDTEDAIRKRLMIYERNIADLLTYYRSQNKVIEVNGDDTISAVEKSISQKLERYDR